jgi:hypothetical protein
VVEKDEVGRKGGDHFQRGLAALRQDDLEAHLYLELRQTNGIAAEGALHAGAHSRLVIHHQHLEPLHAALLPSSPRRGRVTVKAAPVGPASGSELDSTRMLPRCILMMP